MKPLFTINKETKCWEWNGPKNHLGYGVFRCGVHGTDRFRRTGAHRMAWAMRNGEIPDGMMVLHICNNPACVNADHLYLGDHNKNMEDRMLAGNYKKGEESPVSVATEEIVRKIMAMPDSNDCETARQVGVSRDIVRRVRLGKTWTHITGGPLVPKRKQGQRKV